MYYCEMRLILFPPQEDRRFEYSRRKDSLKKEQRECIPQQCQCALGKGRSSPREKQATLLRRRPAHTCKQCPPHLRTVHKQEDARTDLIRNTDQKEIPALKFLKWSFLTSFASYWPVLSSSRGQRMYIFLCWKVALLAGTFWMRVLWSTLVGIPIKIIEQKHAQVL